MVLCRSWRQKLKAENARALEYSNVSNVGQQQSEARMIELTHDRTIVRSVKKATAAHAQGRPAAARTWTDARERQETHNAFRAGE